MSTKGTIFLTKDNEHCYEECVEYDGDEFRVYLEIDNRNIMTFYNDDVDGLVIGIKGDSELAMILRELMDAEDRIRERCLN